MKITLKQLRVLGACSEQVALFKETFGKEVEITKAVCKEHGSKFDTNWLSSKLFDTELYAEYLAKCAPLFAEYEAKCAPLLAEYQAKYAQLDAEYRDKYQAKYAQLDAEYLAKCATLDAEYRAECATLDAEYEAKCALAFWKCLKKMEEKK